MRVFFIILAVSIAAYLTTINKIVTTQLNGLKDFYANIDQYSSQVSQNQNLAPPQSLYSLAGPLNN